MRFPADLSIRNKLIGIILLTSAVTVGIGSALIIIHDVRTYKRDMVAAAEVLSDVTGYSIIGELSFGDDTAARDTLSKLHSLPSISNVYVYDSRGRLFVAFDRRPEDVITPPVDVRPVHYFAGGYLHMIRPIIWQEKQYGTIYMRTSTKQMESKVRDRQLLILSLLPGLIAVSLVLAYFLQRIISRPILHLASVAKTVSEKGDYAIRVEKSSRDELGALYDGLNEMLTQIDRRDRERSEIEGELKRAQAFLTNVIDSMPSLLIAIDTDGNVTQWNQAATRLTGLPSGTAIGQKLWDTVPAFAKYQQYIGTILESRHSLDFYKEVFQVGDGRCYLNVSLFPLVAAEHSGIVIMADNVTEVEAKEQQLRQAQKMETIGTLAGGLAHDFNNVLGGIIGAVSLMRYKLQTSGSLSRPELERYLAAIGESASRAADLVHQLLALGKKRDLSVVAIDLNQAVKHVMTICRNTFDKSIEIEVVRSTEPACVSADPTQIEQVLLNLCVNASHAMTIMRKEGEHWGGKLSVALRKVLPDKYFLEFHPGAQPQTYWNLSVTDTGVGMDTKTMARIFDAFFTTKVKGTGTGLGLTMTYNIVQEHKGFIDLSAEVGKGTTFDVFLPALAPEALLKARTDVAKGVWRGQGTILIADDEPLMRDFAREALQECGYQVLLSEDGQAAVEAFRANRREIDLVILDLVMPKMSGIEAFLVIRNIEPDAKVLLASGYSKDERVDEALTQGALGFIEKPYSLERLSRTVHQVLSKPTGGRASTRETESDKRGQEE